MNSFFLILHSWFRWLILIAAVWTVIRAIAGVAGHKHYTKADNRSSLFFLIFMDLQFLIGIVTYFVRGWASKWNGDVAAMMQNTAERFFALEHVVLMIVALVLVHVGRRAVKKGSVDRKKHSRALLYFGLALILIFVAIPWPFRAEIARPLFRF